MLLYKKKNNKIFYFIIFIFSVLFIALFFDKSGLEKIRKCRCIGPGIVGEIDQRLRIFLEAPVLLRSPSIENNVVIDYSKKIYHAFHNKIKNDHQFDSIKIDIPFEELEILRQDRKKALSLNKLANPRKINITIAHKNKKYKATARLKGDLPEHWQNYNQWSLKIKLKKSKTILSMNEFSLMIHSERDFPYNFLFSKIYKDQKLIIPDYKTVKVNFNGNDWGLMLMEENFGENFYFKNKIKEAPIFKMTNEEDFLYGTIYNNKIKNIEDIVKWQGKIETKVYNENSILKKTNIPFKDTNENLLSIFKNIQEAFVIDKKKYSPYLVKYLDLEQFAKVMAISSIFGDIHSTQVNNARYYLNPYDLKVAPILTDQIHGKINEKFFIALPRLYRILFTNDDFKIKYLETIKDIDQNLEIYVKEVDNICNKYGKVCRDLFNVKDIKQNINYILKEKKNIFRNIINSDQENQIERKLNTKLKENIVESKLYFRIYQDGNITINNLTGETLRLNKILLSEEKCKKIKCKNKNLKINTKEFLLNESIVSSSNKKIEKKNLSIFFKKEKYKYAELIYLDENDKEFISSARIENENLKPLNFFKTEKKQDIEFMQIKGQAYIVPKGNYNINFPIIIPDGFDLKIMSGTNLNMSSNSYIEVKNGTFSLVGSKDLKINIKSLRKNEPWKGIYVNSKNLKNKTSNLNFVNISGVTYFDNKRIQLTGGVNFINANVNISNSNIYDSKAEDAINFVNSKIEVNNLRFENISSDAVDVDFGSGNINNVIFKDIGGDAIDLSNSNIFINNFKAEKVSDKAISAGEKSTLKIINAKIKYAKMGIASKDSSNVLGEKISISNCLPYDFAVFRKKNYFKGGNMNLQNVVKDCNQTLVQKNSKLSINNKNIKEKNFNVKKLY